MKYEIFIILYYYMRPGQLRETEFAEAKPFKLALLKLLRVAICWRTAMHNVALCSTVGGQLLWGY